MTHRIKADARLSLAVHEFIHGRFVIFSALPYNFHILSARASALNPLLHGIVERTASEASPDNENVLFIRVKSIILNGFLPGLLSGRDDFLSDRVAGDDYPVSREESLHSFICNAYTLCLLAENLVSKSGISVLLLDKCRNTKAFRCPEQGSACISAHSDCDVRLEVLQDFPCHPHTSDHLERQGQIAQSQLALKSCNREADYFITGCRHFLHLHPSLGSYKQDLSFRIQFLQLSCDGKGREDVASRSASADYRLYFFI